MELVSAYIKETLTLNIPEEISEEKINKLDNFGWYNYGPKSNEFTHKGILVFHEDRAFRVIVQFKRTSPNSTIFKLRKPSPSIIFEVSINQETNEIMNVLGVYNGMNFVDAKEFKQYNIPEEIIEETLQKLILDLTVEV